MRIIRDYNICILLRPHEWDIVNYYSPVNNSSFLEIEVVSKMCKKCFFKSKLIDLKSRLNFMSCLKDQGCFQSPSEFLFSNYPPTPLLPDPHLVEILCRQNPHVSTKEAIKFFWVCLRYILGPHLMTRNGYWIRSLSSSKITGTFITKLDKAPLNINVKVWRVSNEYLPLALPIS